MKEKSPNPFQFAAGYSLDLYCDHMNDAHLFSPLHPGYMKEYYGQTFRECLKMARADGWRVRLLTRTATCPLCRGK